MPSWCGSAQGDFVIEPAGERCPGHVFGVRPFRSGPSVCAAGAPVSAAPPTAQDLRCGAPGGGFAQHRRPPCSQVSQIDACYGSAKLISACRRRNHHVIAAARSTRAANGKRVSRHRLRHRDYTETKVCSPHTTPIYYTHTFTGTVRRVGALNSRLDSHPPAPLKASSIRPQHWDQLSRNRNAHQALASPFRLTRPALSCTIPVDGIPGFPTSRTSGTRTPSPCAARPGTSGARPAFLG